MEALDQETAGIREIIDMNDGEYLCVMEDDEDLEWKRLPPTHPLIPKFKKERQNLLRGVSGGPMVIPISELGEFMSSAFEDI